ncbi:alpha-glucosidase C-terminal domain-containing protein, partial [Deinococcus sp.]|uniref:alpha-glucosidase C-terminal domain-containing protein n=1 Tax=Deinococcus sp. TaxID=47478 RepID=UPI00286E0720
GFTDRSAEPWLPVAENFTAVNVAAQERDPDSDLNYFRALTKLRQGSEALTAGSYRSLDTGTGMPMQQGAAALTGGSFQNVRPGTGVFGFVREAGEERVLVLLNFGAGDAALNLPELKGAALLLSSHAGASSEVLRGNEAQLWRVG